MTALYIRVHGVVQGVGFRPFVYGLATELGLAGWVRNTSSGVEIALEGAPEALERFQTGLTTQAPPRARIEKVTVEEGAPDGLTRFEIRASQPEPGAYQLVSPDIALCDDCRRELLDPSDRRYRYPFINCTNCGPRFTIIRDIPYDRPQTTMAPFKMCPQCQAEYDDPANRRFHAQPNACPVCGPHVALTDRSGHVLAEREEAIQRARQALQEGKIVAVKGLGGFQLACDAGSEEAVATLRARKRRPHKPFAVMVADLEAARRLGPVSPAEAALLQSPEHPIVLLQAYHENRTAENAQKDSASFASFAPFASFVLPPFVLAPGVAPGAGTVGVMLPYTPLHVLLLEPASGYPWALVMTSGNLTEEPIAMENEEALARLGDIADLFLLHNRGIYARYDDSVYFVPNGEAQPLRRARGYAPFPVRLPGRGPQVLACGPELKNTFCLTRDEYAFLSPHIGDLENQETLDHYERSVEHYTRLFRLQPQLVAYDLHPDYLATRYARERLAADPALSGVGVQHHHAHIAACLADNGRSGPALGVAFDGTGYGVDGTIWGGEFMQADLGGFQRLGHLRAFALPGGEAAIRRPWRTALSLALAAGLDPAAFPALAQVGAQEMALVGHQVEHGLNAPITTSAGRLFDGVAALCGVRGEVTYEAQAAMELEALAHRAPAYAGGPGYPLDLVRDSDAWVLDWRPLLEALLADVRAGVALPVRGLRFHVGLSRAIVALCQRLAAETGLHTVALSGGCFQNELLLTQTVQGLHEAGLEPLIHHQAPANDGGVALGQAAIGAWRGRD